VTRSGAEDRPVPFTRYFYGYEAELTRPTVSAFLWLVLLRERQTTWPEVNAQIEEFLRERDAVVLHILDQIDRAAVLLIALRTASPITLEKGRYRFWCSHSVVVKGHMASSFTDARKRQLARLGGAKPPTARAAIALAKSQAYQDAADAPATLRAYATDLANYRTWCDRHGFQPMPATPEVVGAYLAAAGEGYALPTLRRRVAAIARACGVAGQPLDTKHPAIRETLRGIGRKHGAPSPAGSRADDGGGQAAVPGMRG
jgi:hypothetical protein